jgi:hypothetical protein
MRRRLLLPLALLVAGATTASAATPPPKLVTKPVYVAMMKKANHEVGLSESKAEQGLMAKTVTVSELKTLLKAWAASEIKWGHAFARVTPPDASAAQGNRLLSRGELDYGAALNEAATNLPAKKAAALPYLDKRLTNAKGAIEIDQALKLLKKVGYSSS